MSDAKEMHSKQIVEGAISQCKKYGYDLSVFTTATTLKYFHPEYNIGASNIFNLINFELFDGVVIDTLTLSNTSRDSLDKLYERIKTQAKCPVVNLSYEYEDYKTIVSQNDDVLRSMCRHMVEVHNCRKFCILTGPEGECESVQRLNIMTSELSKYGITIENDQIFYGDFWYTSGEKLADRIASGEVSRPEAILCASNHMGLGLIKRLVKNGLRVPEDIAVIAFDTTELSMLNDIPMTSYDSNWIGTSADAVDYIRNIIEPEQELLPYVSDSEKCLSLGKSCGCHFENSGLVKSLGASIYRTERNFLDEDLVNTIDIGYLMEGNCYDLLCESKNIEECFYNILDSTYAVRPFEKFYLCLRNRWEDFNEDIKVGYPEQMKLVIKRDECTGESFHSNAAGILFDTKEMVPGLKDFREEPNIFYFMAMHFNDVNFGYSVLQRKMDSKHLDIVYRNWIRFVCSALEMIRMREIYFHMSIVDSMTGMTNKRGMYEALDRMLFKMKPDESIYVAVIDMDGLKYINDTFGHVDGDMCLKRLSHVINLITKPNEISVRAGGDEFYIIGVGDYSENILKDKIVEFERTLNENNVFEGKEYTLSASIGNTLSSKTESFDIDNLIKSADKKMYEHKKARKKARE